MHVGYTCMYMHVGGGGGGGLQLKCTVLTGHADLLCVCVCVCMSAMIAYVCCTYIYNNVYSHDFSFFPISYSSLIPALLFFPLDTHTHVHLLPLLIHCI